MMPKQRFLKPLFPLATGLIVAIMLVGLLVIRVPSASGRSAIADVQLEGFRYIVNQDDVGSYFVYVFYDGELESGLRAYVIESRRQGEILLRRGIDPLYMEVTFNSPLPLDEFTRLVMETGMQVNNYSMRAIDARGDRVGIQGSPRGGELVPAALLNWALSGIAENSRGQAEFKGFISVEGLMNWEGYQKLLAHPKVFLVDVTVNLAQQALKAKGRHVGLRDISLLRPPPYWFMENLGLEKFQ